jgi:small subunit ribosomal protein S5
VNQQSRTQEKSDTIDKLVHINRVAKVLKGGRRFAFSALVIAGDEKGSVGYGSGKALEVMPAKTKAVQDAKKNMVRVPLKEGRTLHHDVVGRFGAARVHLRSAPPGTGIIAGGALRAVFECLGIQDIVVKSTGTNNPYNMVKACFSALQDTYSPRQIAEKRGKKTNEIISRREMTTKAHNIDSEGSGKND